MNANNHCLGWHLQTSKHYYSDEALILKDFRILYSIFLFCNFQLRIFSCGLGKQYTIFNREYDPITAIIILVISQKHPCLFYFLYYILIGSKSRGFFYKWYTNNWAVLVDTSRFWFNYRHVANVLTMCCQFIEVLNA
jgi:hypothetical protein